MRREALYSGRNLSMTQEHQQKIDRVSSQIQAAVREGRPVKFQKKSVRHFVPNPYADFSDNKMIDLRNLDQIISIDPKEQVCVAEPGVTFEDLVQQTLKHNLIPACVSELKTITIGGAVSGCSIESMSYHRGGFHDSCTEYEIIDGQGNILTCAPDRDTELFHMIHGSYGTLGVLTKLTFKLLPAKPYVRMEYRTYDNFDAYWADLSERCTVGDYDFIDSIIHGPKQFVICLGNMVDTAPYLSDYSWLNIFYQSTMQKTEDYMTVPQYFFRYDTECHWLTKTVPPLQNKAVRAVLGKAFLGSDNLIKWSGVLAPVLKLKRRQDVVVDVFIPSRNFGSFVDWYGVNFNFWPLWIVPYKVQELYPWISEDHKERMSETFMIDCAVYGKPNNDPQVDFSEVLEKKVYELGGIKTLISRNHYGEDEFWDIYNKPMIEKMKQRIDPNGVFQDLYDKFAPARYR